VNAPLGIPGRTVLCDVALWLRPAGWPPLPDTVRRRTLLLAWAVILTQLVFVGGRVLAGALEHHYSPVRQYISELSRNGATNPWIFTAFVGIWGLGFIARVPSLRTRLWPHAMPLHFVLAGACAILVGPPWTPGETAVWGWSRRALARVTVWCRYDCGGFRRACLGAGAGVRQLGYQRMTHREQRPFRQSPCSKKVSKSATMI
jgi:hypothetical protein